MTIEDLSDLTETHFIIKRLEISWIKAHVGHQENERADQLAREAGRLEHNV